MFGNSKKQEVRADGPVTTVIGPEITITGDIKGEKTIRIDGTVTGNVSVESKIIIGQTGLVKGNIESNVIDIFGKIIGNVLCKDLMLSPSSKIDGDIATETIEIKKGSVYNGKLKMTNGNIPVEIPAYESELQEMENV